NVRELENTLERAVIVAAGGTLEIDPTWLAGPAVPTSDDKPPLAEMERRAILDALERSGGKVYGPGGAAEALGLNPTTLYGSMRKARLRKQAGSLKFECPAAPAADQPHFDSRPTRDAAGAPGRRAPRRPVAGNSSTPAGWSTPRGSSGGGHTPCLGSG